MDLLKQLARDDRGASLAEYALVAGVFGILMLGVMQVITTQSGVQLTTTQNNLTNAANIQNGSY